MAITWTIATIEKAPTEGSLSDVCKVLHWRADDKETVDGVDYTGGSYGSVNLAAPDASSFTAYASITEANAVSWVKSVLGSEEVTATEDALAAKIAELKVPVEKTGIPWGPTPF